MLNFIKKIFSNKTAGVIIVVIALVGGYYGYKTFFSTPVVTRYVTTKVAKDTLIVSVSGSGQVAATDQIDIKPKVSGDVVYIGASDGQAVKAGSLIVQLDSTDAQKTVRDAQVNLDSANLALKKFSLQNTQQSRGDSLNTDYASGMNTLSKLYGEFSADLESLKNIYFITGLSPRIQTVCDMPSFQISDCDITYYANYFANQNNNQFSSTPGQILTLYNKINELYGQSVADYQAAKISGDNTARGKAIAEGHDLVVQTSEMIKMSRDVIQSFQDTLIQDGRTFDHQAVVDQQAKDLTNYSTIIVGYETNLLGVVNSANSYFDSIANQPIDFQSQQLNIQKNQNALLDAKDKLADYYIYAPFGGVINKINVKKADSISPSTIITTLSTRQQVAEISLNEVDIAKIKLGQKATLTFDAIPNLSITSKIVQIDSIGTVSQGVVTYNVKIAFDTQNDIVKSGMSVSAAIITDVKQDVLVVPNGAVKSQGGSSYVEMFDTPLPVPTDGLSGSVSNIPPNRVPVEIGLSNDSQTEIVSGLKEGDEIVTRTILPSSSTTTTSNLFGGAAGGGNRGGATSGGIRLPTTTGR